MLFRSENDGNASPFWSALNAEFPHWLTEKKLKVLVYYGAIRNPEIPGPWFMDMVQDPAKRALMEVAQSGLAMGRPVTAPPGVDAEKVAMLRKAFDSVFRDKDYLAECERQRLNCSTPSGGPQVLDFVKKIYASPKEAVEKITAIYQEGQGG